MIQQQCLEAFIPKGIPFGRCLETHAEYVLLAIAHLKREVMAHDIGEGSLCT